MPPPGSRGNFSDLLARTRGLRLRVADARDAAIQFIVDSQLAVAGAATPVARDEAYELRIDRRTIRISARTEHGLFNGSMTLWQWLTADTSTTQAITVPCVRIADYPRFAWRGLMLDSARHFQPPEFVENFIDEMARHKLNVLHWHLTDDQGWRIQINKYPRAHRHRRLAHAGVAARRCAALRRLLHAGRNPRDRALRRATLRHDRAGDRDARPCAGGDRGVSAIRRHRQASAGFAGLGRAHVSVQRATMRRFPSSRTCSAR